MSSRWPALVAISVATVLSASCENHYILAHRARTRGLRPVSEWRAFAGPGLPVAEAADSVVRASGGDPSRFFIGPAAVDTTKGLARLRVLGEADFARRNANVVGNPGGDFQLIYDLRGRRVVRVELFQ